MCVRSDMMTILVLTTLLIFWTSGIGWRFYCPCVSIALRIAFMDVLKHGASISLVYLISFKGGFGRELLMFDRL